MIFYIILVYWIHYQEKLARVGRACIIQLTKSKQWAEIKTRICFTHTLTPNKSALEIYTRVFLRIQVEAVKTLFLSDKLTCGEFCMEFLSKKLSLYLFLCVKWLLKVINIMLLVVEFCFSTFFLVLAAIFYIRNNIRSQK